MTEIRTEDADSKHVASVERAIGLLRAFSRERPRMTLAELAEAAGFYKSTTLRLAQTLEAAGLLARTPDGRYYIGAISLELARLHQQAVEPAELILPILRQLVAETGESACFNIKNGEHRVCLYRIESPHRLRDHVAVGDIIPLKNGAAGHVLAAFSGALGARNARVRKTGTSISMGEVTPGVAAVAAPVFEFGGVLAGALTVSGPSSRLDDTALRRMESLALIAANNLSILLGGTPFKGPCL